LVNALSIPEGGDGPTAVELAVMLALIVVVCIAAINGHGLPSQQGNLHEISNHGKYGRV